MAERLIDLVAGAETPADALRSVRDWLEQAGMPTAALAVERERTDVAYGWEGKEFKAVERATLETQEEAYEDGRREGQAEGEEIGYAAGWAACEAAERSHLPETVPE
jgi:flagellar biosynthesis/type III secretory pathway protein FliH